MNRILAIVLVLSGCKNAATNRVTRHLGGDAVCGDLRYGVVNCTKGGALYACTVDGDRVGCALVDHPTIVEGK